MRWIVYSLIFINIAVPVYFLFFREQPVTEPVAQVAEQAPTLQLIKDTDGTLPARVKAAPGTKLCYALGPYADEISARLAQARAAELSFTGLISTVDVPLNKDAEYWVHVPPRKNRSDAVDTLHRLQQQNIDSYIITQGDLAEGISLGLFHSKESAERLTARLQQMDFDVAIREIGKTRTEYWLEVREVSRLDDRIRQRLAGADTGVQWQMIGCYHQGSR